MATAVKMRPLSERQYAKTSFRASQAALSYPEKVRQLVMLQERLRPSMRRVAASSCHGHLT